MKASEMTNDQIADTIESAFCASSSEFGATMREAVERLRKLDAIEKALKVAGETAESFAKDNADRRRLKVAEDALKHQFEILCDNCELEETECEHCARNMDYINALAAIREEGGES